LLGAGYCRWAGHDWGVMARIRQQPAIGSDEVAKLQEKQKILLNIAYFN